MPRVQYKNSEFQMCPGQSMDYHESVLTLRAMLRAVGRMPIEERETYTWHSCKTTILDRAAHQEENPMAIGLQGHWKDPLGPMPMKYTRKRMAIPLAMVARVCKRVRDEEGSVEPPSAPEPNEPAPILPPAQEAVWLFYTANSQAYRVGAKVHAAKPGQPVSLCNKLSTCRAASVQRLPEEALRAPCRAAMQRT